MKCIKGEVRRRVLLGLLTHREGRMAIKRSRRSTCARVAATRCCIANLRPDGTPRRSQCRTIPAAACVAGSRFDLAVDIGPGTCFPNPCEP